MFRDARHILTAPVADLPKDELVDAMTGEACSRPRCAHRPRRPPVHRCCVVGARPGDAFGDVRRSSVARRRGRRPGRRRRQRQARGRRARSSGCAGRAGTVEVDGRPLRPGSVPAALAAGRRAGPAGPAPAGPRAAAVGGRERHDDRARPARAGSGLHRPAPARRASPASCIDAPRRQDAGPGRSRSPSCPAATSRRSSWAGRWPATRSVLVLIAPTAGRRRALQGDAARRGRQGAPARGTGVLVVSDELDDLRGCDRVLVMFHGRVVARDAGRLARQRAGRRDGRGRRRADGPDDQSGRRTAPRAAASAGGCRARAAARPGAGARPIIAIAIVGCIVSPVFLHSDNIINVLQTHVRDRARSSSPRRSC